jgi:hypothetical protein
MQRRDVCFSENRSFRIYKMTNSNNFYPAPQSKNGTNANRYRFGLSQPHLLELFAVLHVHVPRAIHGLLVNVEPPLSLLHHLSLLVLFLLTSYIDTVHVLVLRVRIQLPPLLRTVLMHLSWVDIVVYL